MRERERAESGGEEREVGGLFRQAATKRWSVDLDDDATVIKTVEQGVNHVLWFQQMIPGIRFKVGCDNGGFAGFVAFLHELEKSIHLLFVQGQIAQFILCKAKYYVKLKVEVL